MDQGELQEAARKVLQRERAAVAERLEEERSQADRLRSLLDRLDQQACETARLLRELDESLGLAPQLPLEALSEDLRGQRLREAAVSVLRTSRQVGEQIHYTEWLGLLEDLGARVGGKNPRATFLTQIAQAPQVESVRPRSGLYRLTA